MKTKSNFQQDSEVTLDLRLRLKPIFVVVGLLAGLRGMFEGYILPPKYPSFRHPSTRASPRPTSLGFLLNTSQVPALTSSQRLV